MPKLKGKRRNRMPDEKTSKSKRAGATGEFERFRRSGWGQIAEGLFVVSKESKKWFWFWVFIALWTIANGFNNIGNLIKLVKQGRSLVTLINPIAADVPATAPDTTGGQ